ncbi:hypothetical protein AK812_SmicGene6709 [Symbiodinium microadriaticum]|uniref:Uncharacterized protein n=1 Tax=Symbiodinium microadriaticum TaxID=2951 RepID=A0A1Q9EQD7_SYMMI|nr:hypothetical protein AK812_SmicGene6709 [Symbiodinium microadriaticum]
MFMETLVAPWSSMRRVMDWQSVEQITLVDGLKQLRSSRTQFNLANLYLQSQRLDEALAAYRRSVAADPLVRSIFHLQSVVLQSFTLRERGTPSCEQQHPTNGRETTAFVAPTPCLVAALGRRFHTTIFAAAPHTACCAALRLCLFPSSSRGCWGLRLYPSLRACLERARGGR